MSNLHISISAESILKLANFNLSNSFLVTIIVSLILMLFAFWFYQETKLKKHSSFYVLMVTFFKGFYGFMEDICQDKVKQIYPLLATFFIFILLSNWIGLLPGFGSIGLQEEGKLIPLLRGPTADINNTLALALISVASIQYVGIKNIGLGAYLSKFLNFKSPMAFIMGILEINTEISRIISFSFRLFGNIFAGEVLLAVIAYLIPILASLPFLGLEVFVGIIQALVFTMLTLVFMTLAATHHNN